MRRTLAVAVLAAGLAGMGSAVAAPFHGGPGGGMLFGPRLEAVKPSLNLTADQEARWNAAVALAEQTRNTIHGTMQATRQAIRDEMAKSEPDLFRVAQLRDAAEDSVRIARRQVRDTWLQVYAALSPAQQATVREAMRTRAGGRPWGGGAPRS